MTTYVTRSPLQPLHNPHMMSELRRSSRRTSANLAPKENAPIPNGGTIDAERGKDIKNSLGRKVAKTATNGSSSMSGAVRGKRKFGE